MYCFSIIDIIYLQTKNEITRKILWKVVLQHNNMAPEVYENTCRICLSSDTLKTNKGMSLFQTYKDSLISDHINSITNVEIKMSDGLPKLICPDCLLELEAAINFKQKCEKSNSILHKKDRLENYDVKFEIDADEIKKEEEEELTIEEENYNYELDSYTDTFLVEKGRPSRAIDEKLICDDCGGTFPSKCKLRVHWKKVHLQERLICQTCKRNFKSYKAYNRHLKIKLRSCVKMKNVNIQGTGKSRLYLCKACPYISKRNKDIQCHLLTHTGEKPVKCPLCPMQYTQTGSMQFHLEHVHGKNKVETTCQYCGKIVKGRRNIYNHMKRHRAVQVQCDICKKHFRDKRNLVVHMVRHTGDKLFTCEKCAHSFFTLAELCNHKRKKHTNHELWYKCELCDYRSHRSGQVKSHQTKHTGSNLACKICGKFFESDDKLAQHLPRHSEDEKKNQCPHCGRKFFKKDSVRKHIKAKHAVLSRPIPIKREETVEEINMG